jgi:hypothetical protein
MLCLGKVDRSWKESHRLAHTRKCSQTVKTGCEVLQAYLSVRFSDTESFIKPAVLHPRYKLLFERIVTRNLLIRLGCNRWHSYEAMQKIECKLYIRDQPVWLGWKVKMGNGHCSDLRHTCTDWKEDDESASDVGRILVSRWAI